MVIKSYNNKRLYRPPRQKYCDILCRCFSSDWCVIPLLLVGLLDPFYNDLTMKYTPKMGVGMYNWCQSEQVLFQLWCLVAFMKTMNLLHRGMHAVLYRRTAMTIKMANKVSCCPGGRRGNTEQEAVQWQRLVAPGVAPDMLNWVMRSVWLQCIRVAIKVAHDWATFFRRRHLFWFLLTQPKTMLWSIKINSELDNVFYYVIN